MYSVYVSVCKAGYHIQRSGHFQVCPGFNFLLSPVMSTLCTHAGSTSNMLTPTTNTPQASRVVGPPLSPPARWSLLLTMPLGSMGIIHYPKGVCSLQLQHQKLQPLWHTHSGKTSMPTKLREGNGKSPDKNTTDSYCSY